MKSEKEVRTMIRNATRALAAVTVLISAIGGHAAADVPTTATAVKPIGKGEKAPDAMVYTRDNQPVKLSDIYSKAPTVVIFYRGGWCPYCNKHLSNISKVEKDIAAAGAQIIAVTPDSPEYLSQTAEKAGAHYQLLSDSAAEAIKAYGLAYKMEDSLVDKYKTRYQIDLEKRAGGKTHHIMPVPAAYVVDKYGVIRYSHWDPDYAKRVNEQELLAAVKGK
jgi:peroxiredoxin